MARTRHVQTLIPSLLSMKGAILIIESDSARSLSMSYLLSTAGYSVVTCVNGKSGFSAIKRSEFDLIICELKDPYLDALEITRKVRNLYPKTGVIIIASYADVKTAVQAIKEGAFDYMVNPFSNKELLNTVKHFFNITRGHGFESIQNINAMAEFKNIIGASQPMRKIFHSIITIAKTDVQVLIQGESGTGKELVADAIHNLSLRKDKPLLKINCAAIPETLLESELFGYEKGAFTGAVESRKGKFEIADEGTIFFDEIADMPLSLQAKILRVIEEHNITRLGSNKSIKINARAIYATSKDIKKAVGDGDFREDLYYRINVVPITIPPLRERKEDISHLINYFLKYFKEKFKRIDLNISRSAFNALLSYSYPGNVRELKHAIERAVILTTGKVIELGDLPDEISSARDKILFNLEELTLKESIRRAERERILQAINKTGGKKTETAKLLGVGRKTLWKKLKEYGIE